MKSTAAICIVFFCIIGVALSYSREMNFSSSSDTTTILRLPRAINLKIEEDDAFNIPMSRYRRVPAAGDTRACGRKLVLYVMTVCGGTCNAQEGKDIATACCSSQCSHEYVKSACCP